MRLSNSSGFAGASWVEYATSVAWFVMPGDGAKTVWAQFRDPAGNESLPASGTISLLATPPSSGTLLLAGGAAATSSQTVGAAIGASGAATMRLFVNGVPVTGWDPYATSTSVNLGATPDEATRVVSVSFRNAAGVEGGGTSATIRYDRTAPGAGAIALLGALGNGAPSSAYTAAAAIVAAVTPPGTDASELALAQVDPAVACSTAFAVPGWQPLARTTPVVLTGADGMKRVCVLFRDTAGNFARASAVGADLRLDTVPPSNPALVNVASATTRSGAAPAVGLPVGHRRRRRRRRGRHLPVHRRDRRRLRRELGGLRHVDHAPRGVGALAEPGGHARRPRPRRGVQRVAWLVRRGSCRTRSRRSRRSSRTSAARARR